MSISYFDVPFDRSDDGALITNIPGSTYPILENQQYYSAACLKLQVPLMTLPVFIPELDLETPAPGTPWNKTVYSCYMTYMLPSLPNGFQSSGVVPLILKPEFSDKQPLDFTQQPTNRYAWLTSYNSVAQMIDSAVDAANTILAGLIGGSYPFVRIRYYFDDTAQKFSIGLWPFQFFETSIATDLCTFNFYFSANMKFMFNGFQTTEVQDPLNTLQPGYFRLLTNSKPNLCITPTLYSTTSLLDWNQTVQNDIFQPPPLSEAPRSDDLSDDLSVIKARVGAFNLANINPWRNTFAAGTVNILPGFIMTSNWSPLVFNPITSIIVTTTLQIKPEATLLFANTPKSVNGRVNPTTYGLNILFDLTVDPTEIGSTQGYLTYNSPTVDLARRVKLTGYADLRDFQVSIQWVDVYGNLRYVTTNSITQNCTLKLAFIPDRY
jgi:hypothetical protein